MVDIKLKKWSNRGPDFDHYFGEFPKGTTVMNVFTWLMSEYENGTGVLTIFGYDKKNPPRVEFKNGVYGTIPKKIANFEISGLRVSKSHITGTFFVTVSI